MDFKSTIIPSKKYNFQSQNKVVREKNNYD